MKIWQKHILRKLIKTFFFFLVCLVAVYVVIDLSAHGVRFFSKSSFFDILIFYLNIFASLLDLFLTLTFLLATMRVLIDLTAHREIVALQMAGLSKTKLLAPFFIFAACLSFICYLNTQWFAPDAQELTAAFKTAHKSKENKAQQVKIFTVSLEDESELIYQKFDKNSRELFDVFWVKAPNDIWHMKSLKIDTLEGHHVNHLIRNSAKQFEKAESFESCSFRQIPLDDEIALHKFVPYECRSISTLLFQALSFPSEKRIIFTHLYYKLLVPLIPFLVLIAVAPFTMRYARNRPLFLITAYSIFGFIALKVTLDGMLILGENQVLPSYVAIWSPILLALSFSMPTFLRMR